GLPPAVIQIGGDGWTGGGKILTLISRPSPLVAGTDSPRQSARIVSMPSAITARRFTKFSGARAKSLACQPEANESPIRPFDRLSTTDQSSAHRIGLWSGSTTLPARMLMRSVTIATAALVMAALG